EAIEIKTIIATHLHPDHVGLAPYLAHISGGPIVMGEHEAQVYAQASRLLAGGEQAQALRAGKYYSFVDDARLAEFGVPTSHWEQLRTPVQAPTLIEVDQR